jgi:starch phosphorylase
MKFSLNGALTLASRTGTNLELMERLGEENVVLFGGEAGPGADYHPQQILSSNQLLSSLLTGLEEHAAGLATGASLNPLLASLRDIDDQYVLFDFADYVKNQDEIDTRFADRRAWSRSCLCSIARSGWFSVDRAAQEHAEQVWKVHCV